MRDPVLDAMRDLRPEILRLVASEAFRRQETAERDKDSVKARVYSLVAEKAVQALEESLAAQAAREIVRAVHADMREAKELLTAAASERHLVSS